jgi:predicted DNA-binding transcriptional regulator AlpA
MRYLPKKEVCYRLAVSRATLDRMRAKKSLNFPPAVKRNGNLGDWCYWLEDDLNDWMRIRASAR